MISVKDLKHKPATWKSVITKKGHYIAMFDDPNNEFRCELKKTVRDESEGVSSLTIECTKQQAATLKEQEPANAFSELL